MLWPSEASVGQIAAFEEHAQYGKPSLMLALATYERGLELCDDLKMDAHVCLHCTKHHFRPLRHPVSP